MSEMERQKISQNANFCRLTMYMCSTGTSVMKLALLDVVFNCLLADEKKNLERAHSEGKLSVRVSLEKLFPTDGCDPKLNDFDDLTIKEVFRMCNTQIKALDYLRETGLNMVLSSHREKLYKQRHRIGEENWKKIDYYRGTVDINRLDVCLLFFIIRNVSKHSKRCWNDMPEKEKVAMEDDVCRIHLYRNILAHYRATEAISDSDFEKMWSALTCAFKRLYRDQDAIERDSIRLKSEPIDPQQQQKYEELVDQWIVEELENVEKLKRHISISQEDSTKQVVKEVKKIVAKSNNRTTTALKSTAKEITKCVETSIEEALTQMKEHASTIADNATSAFNNHLERASEATKNELRTVIGDSLERAGSDIESKISTAVRGEVTEMSSTLTDSVKHEVGSILTSCFETAVQDIEKKVAGIVNDTTLRTIEYVLADRIEQFTEYIIAKVKEELIRSSRSDILKDIVRKVTDVIHEKLAEDGRKQFDNVQRQYASRHPDIDKRKHVQPTDSMNVQVQVWYADEQDFFTTSASTSVVEFLESNKHLSVIGPPLSGKTAIGRHTALHIRCQGYTVFPISDPSEIDRFLSEEGKQIFIIDDPLGKTSVDESRLQEWRKVDERLRMFIQKVDVKVIWIMNSQQVKEDIFKTSGLIFTENQMDITKSELSEEERRGIAAKCLQKAFVEDENAYSNIFDIAAKCNYSFFPKICSDFRRFSKWQQNPGDHFLFPFEVLVDYFEHFPHSSKHQFIAMGLCAIFGRLPSDRKFLDHSIKEGARHMPCTLGSCEIQSALKSLKGIWLRDTEEHFEFSHEIYRDVILFLLGKQFLDPSTVLMNLSCRSIREHVKYDPDSLNEVPEKYAFLLEKRYWKELSFHICHDLLHLRHKEHLNLKEGHNEDTFKEEYKMIVLQQLKNVLANKQVSSDDFLAIATLSIQTENAEMIDTLFQNQSPAAFNTLLNETAENIKMGVVGLSLLHFAVLKSSLWGIEKLLKRGGANINIVSKDGLTPLDLAVKTENLPLVSELIKYGADLNISSNKGLSPVHLAIQLNLVEITCKLVSCNADMTVCTPEGLPPLHLAISRKKTEVVRKLLELDVNTNICDADDTPALNFALLQDQPDVDIIDMMVKHPQTDVNCLDFSRGYDHPLHLAVISRDISLVTVLLESKRMNVNCLGMVNSTPLHIAARNNDMNITTLLLTYKADTTLTDSKGRTPWQIASEHGNNMLATLIKKVQQSSPVL